MIRDEYGIIVQGNENDPTYQDGGDSAFSTGIMSLTGSEIDGELMPKFIINNKLVRHPYQPGHNDPDNTSRDQVIAFFSGTRLFHPTVRSACLQYAKSWFVNKDILTPDVKWYLYKCAGERPPVLLLAVAIPFAFAHLIWACFIKPDHEMNQSVCKFSILGHFWINSLYTFHPDLTKNIRDYFSGWRMRAETGERLIVYIASKL